VPLSWATHSPQNLAVRGLVKPQLAQRLAAGAPHWTQNFSPSAFSKPQLEQFIGLCQLPKTSPNINGRANGVPQTKSLTMPFWITPGLNIYVDAT
jgi:hypothetical protein